MKHQTMGRIRAELTPPDKDKAQQEKRLAKLRTAQLGQTADIRVAASGDTVDVHLFDVIGWPFIEAQDLLYRIPKGAATINVYLNTPGGDVFEGMAIYNMLCDHKATVNVIVTGLAASSGSLIAMAGDTIKMSKASFMMIHNPWSMMSGDADDFRKEADLLDQIGDVFATAYAEKTGIGKSQVRDLMKEETWYTPEEAVAAGFANDITGEVPAEDPSARFDLSVFNHTPSSIRQGSAQPKKENIMDPKLRALLERLGLSKDADDEQAKQYLAGINLDDIADPEELKTLKKALADKPAVPQSGVTPSDPAFSQADLDEAARKAATEERQRVFEIRKYCRIGGLKDDYAQTLIDAGKTVDQAREDVFAEMEKSNPPLGAGAIVVGETDREKFRAAVVDGLAFRCNFRAEKPAAGYESFRAASIASIARQCLTRMGIHNYTHANRDEVAREIFRVSGQGGGFTTDDFTSIFLDVSNKTLHKAYLDGPATWRPIVNIVAASDFKTMYGVSLSEAPSLDLIGENGEYKHGAMSDNQESYSVASYGKMIYLTRQMIVNDDLRAFTRLPQLMGSAARRKESDLVWAKITGNPTMSDSVALFHADHGNLAASGAAVSSTTLSAGRKAMRTQKGSGGLAYLDLMPAYLAHPVAIETEVEILLRSTALPDDDKSSGVYNPWGGKLTPISDPRLDADSETAWYLIADPTQIDTVEVAYLNGNEMPYTEEKNMFERDAIGYKIRHDIGVGAMDYRGFYKNPGA
ncbi:ClpP-like prohead protease/major capsid protein fusion protein [uncultured Desulfobacter sp.]|uniref:ClpP-like prohead protease/major capsid protein fusion protein n=1 Tax=uncultured Desulfobacter sp. TaxID=240139 RepID=UPI0029F5A467|nr:ClpP-like prohead protease/major capsid protein fusion protein [uncultured Desulfobacter sp.]